MIPGIPMTLGDGKSYTIPPLTLGALEDLQDRIDKVSGLDKDSISAMIDVAHASLKRNYPEITRNDVREIIDIANMQDVFESCMDAAGLKRAALEKMAAEDAGDAGGNEQTASA